MRDERFACGGSTSRGFDAGVRAIEGWGRSVRRGDDGEIIFQRLRARRSGGSASRGGVATTRGARRGCVG